MIGIGASTSKANPADGNLSTDAVTTATSGSVFVVGVAAFHPALFGGPVVPTPGDNKGNTYTPITSGQTLSDGNGEIQWFYKENGAGGSGHVISVTGGQLYAIWLVEILNALTSGSLDQAAAGNDDTSSPYTSNTTGTTAQGSELVLALLVPNTPSGTDSFTIGNGMTEIAGLHDAISWTGALAYKVVSATGTFQSTFTATSTGADPTEAISFIATFKDSVSTSIALDAPQFNSDADGNPFSVTLTGVQAYDWIYVGTSISTGIAHTTPLSDDHGSGYTELDSAVTDSSNQQQIRHFYKQATVAGTYVITCTPTNPDPGQTFAVMVAVRVMNAARVNAITAHGPGNQQTSPGTGTDAVTSGTAQTPGIRPCLVVAFSQDVSVGNLAPDAGTGFTSAGVDASGSIRLESKRITSGNAQGTFTNSSARSTLTQMVAFYEDHPLIDIYFDYRTGPFLT